MFNLDDLQNKRNELEQALKSNKLKRISDVSHDLFACYCGSSCSGGCEGTCEGSCEGRCSGCGSK